MTVCDCVAETALTGERGYPNNKDLTGTIPGADPEIEEGGGIHMNWCGARRTQLSVRALASFPGLRLRAFVACSTSLKSLRTRLRI